MNTYDEIKSWDNFFYYGQNDFNLELEHELMLLLLQPLRSLLYNNQESGGISGYENFPNGLTLQIYGRFTISSAVAWKNRQISDGTNGSIDRRIAVSQNSINFKVDRGELDVEVTYIPYADYSKYQTFTVNIGG